MCPFHKCKYIQLTEINILSEKILNKLELMNTFFKQLKNEYLQSSRQT